MLVKTLRYISMNKYPCLLFFYQNLKMIDIFHYSYFFRLWIWLSLNQILNMMNVVLFLKINKKVVVFLHRKLAMIFPNYLFFHFISGLLWTNNKQIRIVDFLQIVNRCSIISVTYASNSFEKSWGMSWEGRKWFWLSMK